MALNLEAYQVSYGPKTTPVSYAKYSQLSELYGTSAQPIPESFTKTHELLKKIHEAKQAIDELTQKIDSLGIEAAIEFVPGQILKNIEKMADSVLNPDMAKHRQYKALLAQTITYFEALLGGYDETYWAEFSAYRLELQKKENPVLAQAAEEVNEASKQLAEKLKEYLKIGVMNSLTATATVYSPHGEYSSVNIVFDPKTLVMPLAESVGGNVYLTQDPVPYDVLDLVQLVNEVITEHPLSQTRPDYQPYFG